MLGDDLYLVEARTKVHFGEHAGTSHGVQALVYAGDGVHDFLCQLVEAAIVDAEAETAIVLLSEEHACTVRGVGCLDPAVACVLVKLGFEGAVLLRIHSVDPVARRDSVGDQVDGGQWPGRAGGLEEGPRGRCRRSS